MRPSFDLNQQRIAQRMAGVLDHVPTPEQAAARKKALEKRVHADQKSAALGHDGMRMSRTKVKLTSNRFTHRNVRSKPGTFEWPYGRKQDALFHAGSHLAILWERAGMTIASSANFLRGTASGYATELADGRANAIYKSNGFRKAMDDKPAERLIDYCVLGMTTAEIARRDGAKERDMAPVLHQHLRDCARHFKLMGKKG